MLTILELQEKLKKKIKIPLSAAWDWFGIREGKGRGEKTIEVSKLVL